jgi:hypothetical protein
MIQIPTLHLSASFISNPSDILMYLLRHYLYTPANIYESFIKDQYSLSNVLAKSEHDPNHLKELVEIELENYLGKTFNSNNGYSLLINVDIEDVDERNYNLILDVTVTDKFGNTYGATPNVTIDNDQVIKINFSDV